MLFRARLSESEDFIKGYPFKTKGGTWYMHPVDDVFSYVEIDGNSLSMTIEDELIDSDKRQVFVRIFEDGYGGDLMTANGETFEASINYKSQSFHCAYNYWTSTEQIKGETK